MYDKGFCEKYYDSNFKTIYCFDFYGSALEHSRQHGGRLRFSYPGFSDDGHLTCHNKSWHVESTEEVTDS